MKKLFVSLAVPIAFGVYGPAFAQGEGENVTGKPPLGGQVDPTVPPGRNRMYEQPAVRSQPGTSNEQQVAATAQNAIANDRSLSAPARNVKVTAGDRKVVLNGQVQNLEEKSTVVAHVQNTSRSVAIDDRMVVRGQDQLD